MAEQDRKDDDVKASDAEEKKTSRDSPRKGPKPTDTQDDERRDSRSMSQNGARIADFEDRPSR